MKEDILKMMRGKQLAHGGSPVHIFQELSGITLKHRRDLRPLLDTLRERDIRYKWKFPFCLSATHQGRTALLRVPEDLPRFCEMLGLPLVAVPDWYAAFRQSVNRWPKAREEPMETQASRFRRQRSPSASRHLPGSHIPRADRDSPPLPGVEGLEGTIEGSSHQLILPLCSTLFTVVACFVNS